MVQTKLEISIAVLKLAYNFILPHTYLETIHLKIKRIASSKLK